MIDWKAEHDHELALRREWSERAQKAEANTQKLRDALVEIRATPCSMVNDSESLRHTIKAIRQIAHAALKV